MDREQERVAATSDPETFLASLGTPAVIVRAFGE